jgi:predicted metal-binding membrane protein
MRGAREHRQQVARALRWRPEWWIAAVAVLAWPAMLAGVGMGQMNAGMGPMRGRMGSMNSAILDCIPSGARFIGLRAFTGQSGGGAHYSPLAAVAGLPGWSAMVLAMMVPVTLPAVRHVAFNTMHYRRRRAMALYILVYVGCWALFGVAAFEARDLLVAASGISGRALLALAVAAAAAWQLTRTKRRAVLACGQTVPLPPSGLRADLGCVRFAILSARRCMVSCWAIMLVMVTAGNLTALWMVALTALVLAEELTKRGWRLIRPAAGLLGLAAVVVAAGV